MEKKTNLEIAQENATLTVKTVNDKITELGEHTGMLVRELNIIQTKFDKIRNVSEEHMLKVQQLTEIRLSWQKQVEQIQTDYNNAVVAEAGYGAAGVGAGVAVVTLGPTVAMGIATTFGVASTGTAISALSGAAATNAALAWLGGGALAVGGGGMAAGNVFLAMAGPIGWGIAAVAAVASGLFLWKTLSDKDTLENVFIRICERDITSYKLAIVELDERIARIDYEARILHQASEMIEKFGLDYDQMTESQQYKLGTYVNLMLASTQLLVNPILGLQPKYTKADYEDYVQKNNIQLSESQCNLLVYVANLIYKVILRGNEKSLFWNALKNNKDFRDTMKLEEKDFDDSILKLAFITLTQKYKQEKSEMHLGSERDRSMEYRPWSMYQ